MRIGHRYSAERDTYGWTLTEFTPTHNKQGEPITRSRQSYYGTLEQCLLEILDREAGRCPKADHLARIMAETRQAIVEAVRQAASERDTDVSGPETGEGSEDAA